MPQAHTDAVSLPIGPTSAQLYAPDANQAYRSLHTHLLAYILGITVLIGLLASLGVYYSTQQQALELQDHHLELMALLVTDRSDILLSHQTMEPMASIRDADNIAALSHNHWDLLRSTDALTRHEQKDLENELEEARIIIQPLNTTDNTTIPSTWTQTVTDIPDGLATVKNHGEEWRVFLHTLPDHRRFLVGQHTRERDELAMDTSLRMLIPLVVLFPALLIVITLVIRRAFQPIIELTRLIDQQKDGVPLPLENHKIPREIVPFAKSINQLLTRLTNSIEQQRRFIADAAHELRTPVTALVLQTENLTHTPLTREGVERARALQQGLHRVQHLLEQLLSLARQQNGISGRVEQINLKFCLQQTLADLIPLATQKRIDLGVTRLEDLTVQASPHDIQTILRNAIGNAIRYAPDDGQVDILIYSDELQRTVIEVRDNGEGIPEAELSRVFDPFYRVLGKNEIGSGLGLTIIHEIAQHYAAEVRLENLHEPVGFRFLFVMPRAASLAHGAQPPETLH